MLTYSKVTTKDVERIQQLAREIWTISYANMISADQIEYMLTWMYTPETILKELDRGVVWEFIEWDNQSIGFIAITPENEKLKLNKLYILPDMQGKGIGQKALKHVLDYGRDNGFGSVYLSVNKGNNKAIKAYTNAGFICIDNNVFDIGGGYVMDDYIYAYDLSHTPGR